MLEFLLDCVLPRRSIRGEEGRFLTEAEIASFRGEPSVEHAMHLRAKGMLHLDRLVSAKAYADPLLRAAIRRFKYGRVARCAEPFASLIAAAVPSIPDADAVLCPVPLHWIREWSRGFNQSMLLARHIGRLRHLRVRALLRRSRPTGHQAWRTREDRRRALEGAFVVRPPVDRMPAHVILIDDIATTGTTLDACADALKKAGATFVEGWVVARG